jgi:hypothetical protein
LDKRRRTNAASQGQSRASRILKMSLDEMVEEQGDGKSREQTERDDDQERGLQGRETMVMQVARQRDNDRIVRAINAVRTPTAPSHGAGQEAVAQDGVSALEPTEQQR